MGAGPDQTQHRISQGFGPEGPAMEIEPPGDSADSRTFRNSVEAGWEQVMERNAHLRELVTAYLIGTQNH